MRIAFLLAFIALPLLEIGLLIKVGNWIGFWPTLGIVIGTALLGGAIIVQHGFRAAFDVRQAVLRGELPLNPIVDGALVVTAGTLLLTPGLAADVLGLLLLLPVVRGLVRDKLGWALFGGVGPASARPGDEVGATSRQGTDEVRGAAGESGSGPVIEGEFQRLGERAIDPDDPGGSSRRT